jgi:signal transduction histidine kinase
MSRIFEPFFTTKPPGKGLGLGLDAVNRIIQRHSGSINVDSKPGSTCFQVRLPIERAEAY